MDSNQLNDICESLRNKKSLSKEESETGEEIFDNKTQNNILNELKPFCQYYKTEECFSDYGYFNQ